jgi:sigma-B regulation protein RsbU (phosphoserine phosphatase)
MIFLSQQFIKYYEKQKKIEYISAGHNEMLHYNIKKDTIEIINSTSLPLGIFENTIYKSVDKEINKNDTLVLYTDGLTEAQNDEGTMYSFEKLYDTVSLHKKLTPKEILSAIQNSLEKFIKNTPMNDDTTILVSKFI